MQPVMPPAAIAKQSRPTLRSYWVGSAALAHHCVRSATGRRQRYILVLSHMRSGSSLLHHLLQTHPSILGAGESNRVYRDAGDLRRLSLWVHAQRGALLRWRPFVTDQINHNEKLHDHCLLRREEVSTVILIRKPLATVASIRRLTDDFYPSSWDDGRIIQYYLARIDGLVAAAAALQSPPARRPLLVTYEDLTQNTRQLLDALQSHLRLDRPLSSDYGVFPFTGRRGDPSERIHAGRVLPESPRDAAAEYGLAPEQRALLAARYEQAMNMLRACCAIPCAS